MNVIGIQFLKKSISVVFYDKNRLTGRTISSEQIIDESDYALYLNNIFEQLNIHKNTKYRVVISLPTELVEVFTLKQLVPITKKIFNPKTKQNLIMGQIESTLEKNTHEYEIEYEIIDEKQLYNNKMLATILCIKVEDAIRFINKVNSFKNMTTIAIDTEYEALRRLIPHGYIDVAIINFFTEDKNMIGIYMYKGFKLIGLRYLYKELYDTDSIVSEIERMDTYCKTFYRDFDIERWFVFGDKEETAEIIMNENVQEHELSNCSYAVAAGLAIKEEHEKKRIKDKKGGAGKNGI
ncbi:MAG TPA: hypothetical protein DEP72_00080 [Clostridiales bacterium]|nr:MAG: hypothetical protein A2Y18_08380 [Clostridiales bacterium GWD2_32_19]HCC06549.1 hypothetical protein [Clostridiales bacterium]